MTSFYVLLIQLPCLECMQRLQTTNRYAPSPGPAPAPYPPTPPVSDTVALFQAALEAQAQVLSASRGKDMYNETDRGRERRYSDERGKRSFSDDRYSRRQRDYYDAYCRNSYQRDLDRKNAEIPLQSRLPPSSPSPTSPERASRQAPSHDPVPSSPSRNRHSEHYLYPPYPYDRIYPPHPPQEGRSSPPKDQQGPTTINFSQSPSYVEREPPRRDDQISLKGDQPKKKETECCHWTYLYFWFISFVVYAIGVTIYIVGFISFYDEERMMRLLYNDDKVNLKGFNSLGLLSGVAVNMMWTGMAIAAVGFFGCCGLVCRNYWMVIVFAVLIALVILAQVIIFIIFAANKELFLGSIKSTLQSALKDNYDGHANTTNQLSGVFDAFMITQKCCGVTGPDDFRSTVWYANRTDTNQTVPLACCALTNEKEFLKGDAPILKDPTCQYTNYTLANKPQYLDTSCFDVMWERVQKHEHMLKMLIVVLVIFQSTAICSAYTVHRKLKEDEQLIKIKRAHAARKLS